MLAAAKPVRCFVLMFWMAVITAREASKP